VGSEVTALNGDDVRRIVREEIAKALGMLGREASHLDGYDTDTIESYAFGAIIRSAEGAAVRMTCPHEVYESWGGRAPLACRRCGEPMPEPVNPFEENSRG
jgi:hypothetical protein